MEKINAHGNKIVPRTREVVIYAVKRRVGVTAGASAPEVLVSELIARLKELGATSVRPLEGISENVVFSLPRGLAPQNARR